MKGRINAEALKLRTLLLPRLALGLAALSAGFITFAVVQIARDQKTPVTAADLGTAAAKPLWFLAIVVAVLASAGEFQHRTVYTSLLHAPRRGTLLAAKAIVAAGYGAILTLTGTAAAVLVGVVSLRLAHLPVGSLHAQLWLRPAGSIIIGALWAVLAAGLGMLARNSTVALVAVLLWKFVLEGVLPSLTRTAEVTQWLPSGAADALLFGRAGLLEPLGGRPAARGIHRGDRPRRITSVHPPRCMSPQTRSA
jgi:ABC-2 type transport system permease protein